MATASAVAFRSVTCPASSAAVESRPRLVIGDHCFFNVGVTFELGEAITIGRWVTFGPDVMLLTSTHEIGSADHRCADHSRAPIDIGDGVWIGARATVLPGVCIGQGAIVGASALVVADVEPNTVVGGVPAQIIRHLDPDPRPAAWNQRPNSVAT